MMEDRDCMYLLIDTQNAKLISRCKDYNVLDEHALHQGLAAYTIGPTDNLAAFKHLPLQLLLDIAERHEVELPPKSSFNNTLQMVVDRAAFVTRVLDVPKHPRPATTTDDTPASPTTPGTAPKRGVTARVWAIADEVAAKVGGDDLRKAVIDACLAEGINKSTAGTQYAKWRKSRS